MPINPFDPQADTREEIAAKYGDLVKKELYEIGYAYIGARKFNCDEERELSQKRFKIRDKQCAYHLSLWNGTSKQVDCRELSDHEEEDNPTHEIIGKSASVGVVIAQLNEQIEIIYTVGDFIDILHLSNGFSQKILTSIDDLLKELINIRSVLQKHP